MPLINGLSEIASGYDALLCDVWGVLHNGKHSFPGVVAALESFKAKGGSVLLLSNAPRPSDVIRPQLLRLGIPDHAYDDVLTSGDATCGFIETGSLGRACYHLGPARDAGLFDGLNVELTDAESCDFIVNTGPFDDEVEGPEDYREVLTQYARRKLPMICANPDIVVERGNDLIYCAGALAVLYEELGGQVIYFGKPHGPVYDIARERLATIRGSKVEDRRILAIGDGLGTDVKGANGQGIDVIFVTGGIAWAECGPDAETPDRDKVSAVLAGKGVHARAAMPRLIW